MFKINPDTITPLVNQLTKQHPYLEKHRSIFGSIFRTWLLEDQHYRINNSLKILANIAYNNDNSITGYDHIFLNKCLDKKYKIMHDRKLDDFKIIKWASEFYGKSIEELACDAIKMCNYDNPSLKLKDKSLLDILFHLITCDLLICLGILFSYLNLAILVDFIYKTELDQICSTIVEHILANGSYHYGTLVKINRLRSLVSRLNIALKSQNPNAYTGFYKDKFKIIYDMYYDTVVYINSLSKKEYQLFLKNNIDFQVVVSGADLHNCDKRRLLFNYHYLVSTCGISSKQNDENMVSHDIKPRLADFGNLSLVIEV